ncbi:hypothetical protein [Penaeicola halotolerans]|uniref:hypothetical protein n=1 Tax=Penaeicola halotolerans TaxID=2793196 RepID=UPI001CF83F98|nr:hypothetical protein [Penaeicola halotolerans]
MIDLLTEASAGIFIVLITLGFFLAIFLIPFVFYLLTLQNTLKAISPENRKMEPTNVWLLLIPFFGTVYHFIVVGAISDSIKLELEKQKLHLPTGRPAYEIGIAMCVLNVLAYIPVLNYITGVASLVTWIVYWVKINEFKSQFAQKMMLDMLQAKPQSL